MIEKEEFLGMLGRGMGVRVGDGRMFARYGEESMRVKRGPGRGAPVREIEGTWSNDDVCTLANINWEVFTGLAERVQFLVWCRGLLKSGSVIERDGFYLRV